MESGSGYLLQVSGRGTDDMDSIGLNSSGAASQGQSSVLQQEGERVWQHMDPDKPSSLSLPVLL